MPNLLRIDAKLYILLLLLLSIHYPVYTMYYLCHVGRQWAFPLLFILSQHSTVLWCFKFPMCQHIVCFSMYIQYISVVTAVSITYNIFEKGMLIYLCLGTLDFLQLPFKLLASSHYVFLSKCPYVFLSKLYCCFQCSVYIYYLFFLRYANIFISIHLQERRRSERNLHETICRQMQIN